MRKQKASELKFESYFPGLVQGKQLKTRAILNKSLERVVKLCDDYDNNLSNMIVPTPESWSKRTSKALLSCYNVSTKALSALKGTLIDDLKQDSEVNLLRCPYCMLNDPRTWDHYLPKESFPEFSVLHSNLVYICFGCNQRKLAQYKLDGLMFCHPYFTVSDVHPLLHCEVTISNGSLSIQYYGAGRDQLEAAGLVVQEHIDRLHLNKRLGAEAAGLIGTLIGELRYNHPSGVLDESLRAVLKRKFGEAQDRLGVNAWDCRLWHGLHACKEFAQYANERIQALDVPSEDGFEIAAPPRTYR